jgi:hypothetical protein
MGKPMELAPALVVTLGEAIFPTAPLMG